MATFELYKIKDKHFLKNQGREVIKYDIIPVLGPVRPIPEPFTGVVEPIETIELPIKNDGSYELYVDDVKYTTITVQETLLKSILDSIIKDVCDCNCGCDCGEDKNEYCNLLMLKAKMDVFKRITNPEGVPFYNIVNLQTHKLIEKSLYCSMDKDKVLGGTDCNAKLLKQMIMLDYLGRYFFELYQASEQDKNFIKEKFLTKTIFCCIENLGINIQDIEDLINNNDMGTFTINSGSYVNLPPTVGNYETTVVNRAVTTLTLAMFTTSTTPAYNDPEGDAAKQVRIDTLPATGILKLSGTNVTAGQIILVADIVAGNLTFTAPDLDTLASSQFLFSVSDTGSGNFSN